MKFVADEAIDGNKQARCSLKIAHRFNVYKIQQSQE
ncbi:hypothetical protein DFH70_002346 [Clostridium beijerinckii]|uniref:Uncharacterized protein n=1 Tax=Clostridium beijerinckii TaxID=1520 RepID=A0A9Q5CLN6_CLOBE|nr:hypothetical protein [Clostridium beijerinckii]MBA9017086.1 hypothetical protein [Clostridium beijerinckii]MBA9018015.1 hypothetical protein [Clostridium beijerinckii]NRT00491.1 hypothetical protein [Clostridium beijerinckii]NRT04974.1 hypothetical protein [Clostridium beijerinckii]